MIRDLNFRLFDVLNKVTVDKYGRVSAFLALNKPVGITSHDLVDQVRKKLNTRKVGHAGALDPFASGVMLVCVGKTYTAMTDTLLQLDKVYRADVVIGVTTDTLDIEGEFRAKSDIDSFDFKVLEEALKSFEGGYEQFVPVFSSVKINGYKLRVLARQSESFEFFANEGKKYVRFIRKEGNPIEVPLPHKPVVISEIKYIEGSFVDKNKLNFANSDHNREFLESISTQIPRAIVEFRCSKGTYVRQLAYDLAQEIDQVGMLTGLSRIEVGGIKITDCMGIDDLKLP